MFHRDEQIRFNYNFVDIRQRSSSREMITRHRRGRSILKRRETTEGEGRAGRRGMGNWEPLSFGRFVSTGRLLVGRWPRNCNHPSSRSLPLHFVGAMKLFCLPPFHSLSAILLVSLLITILFCYFSHRCASSRGGSMSLSRAKDARQISPRWRRGPRYECGMFPNYRRRIERNKRRAFSSNDYDRNRNNHDSCILMHTVASSGD